MYCYFWFQGLCVNGDKRVGRNEMSGETCGNDVSLVAGEPRKTIPKANNLCVSRGNVSVLGSRSLSLPSATLTLLVWLLVPRAPFFIFRCVSAREVVCVLFWSKLVCVGVSRPFGPWGFNFSFCLSDEKKTVNNE